MYKNRELTKQKTFLIIGGYGNAGYFLSFFLLKESNVRLILAGRNKNKAEELAAKFNNQFKGRRVEGKFVDASKPDSLKNAFGSVDMVIVASSTAKYVKYISRIALEMNIDYLDLIHSFSEKINALKALSSEIKKKERCFITDAGLYPGIPAVMVRYIANQFDLLIKANIGGVAKIDWLSESSEMKLSHNALLEYFMEDSSSDISFFKRGKWKKSNIRGIFIDFSKKGFGKHHFCIPWFLEEIRQLPLLYSSLEEVGFYVSGVYLSGHNHYAVDWVLLPFTAIALKIKSDRLLKYISRLLDWGTKTLKPPYGAAIKIKAIGEREGQSKSVELDLFHEHVYKFTVIPVVACLLQYLDRSITPGLHLQALAVEPIRFMKDLKRMGVSIEQTVNSEK